MLATVGQLSTHHSIGIVTGNSTPVVENFLDVNGIRQCISVIFALDQPGSKVEKITLAQNQFAAKGEAVFMVGDSASDVYAAKEASVKSIAVSWGHQSAETLIRAKPDYLVRSTGELMEVIEKNWING